ncbi:Crp/Fnr family transcriptional regulator [Proteiniphilum sp. UBA1028]|jgi:CRP-like cAMP-binding protein|uniref:Crp/Fnr family transcriptional regulator n=1 Tax=Proteiniphilum sp. UBA1028 TaxID=1947251 RepID=UPI0025F8219A|nr:Crp/Fnr family transcriptional regulator [Proteiniphilum sp. UBA1028]
MDKDRHNFGENRRHSHSHLHHLLENKVSADHGHDELSLHMHHHDKELSYCPLFKGLSQGEHDQFLDRNVKEVLTYKKGETIVLQGEPIRSVMLLVQGSVRTEMITMEGNVLNIDILEAVIPLAPAFIYGAKKSYPVDVIAAEPCVFLKISKDAWLNEMAGNKQLLTNFLTMNADLTFFLTNKLQMISLKSLRKKLATFFLEKTTVEQDSFTLKRSRTQLAEYFGVQRQSLARSLKEMEDDGIILLKGRTVKVLDRNRLIRE